MEKFAVQVGNAIIFVGVVVILYLLLLSLGFSFR